MTFQRSLRVVLFLAALVHPALAQADPMLTVSATNLMATDLTASGLVVWFGASRVGNGVFNQVTLVQKEASVDVTGFAELPFDEGTPQRSVWAVVDVASGGFAVATPEGFAQIEEPFVPEEIGRGANGELDRLIAAHERLLVLITRPGVGAWSSSVGDGRESDADGIQNGLVTAPLATMTTVAGSVSAPTELLDGDVVLWIDLRQLSFMATRLTVATLEAAP